MAEHLKDFQEALASGATGKAGKTDAQVKQVLQRIQAVIGGCKFQSLSELDGDKVAAYLAKRRKLSRKDGGIGAQTSNFYLQAIRHFASWCVIKKRLAENPFEELNPLNVKKDRRHDRRALDLDELKKLLEATGTSRKSFRGLTGRDRRFLYLIAVGTGFRRSELLGLTPHHFDLTAGLVCLSAEETKNGEAARQPLHPEVLAEVRDFLDGRKQDAILWPGTWHEKSAKMIRKDLAEAKLPYGVKGHDSVTRYADFHSLRHSFITALARNGTNIKLAQVLARHSDPKLTLGVYSHAAQDDLSAAVAAMPVPFGAGQVTMTVEQLAIGYMILSVLYGSLVGTLPSSNHSSNQEGRGDAKTNRKSS
jgi:integrase